MEPRPLLIGNFYSGTVVRPGINHLVFAVSSNNGGQAPRLGYTQMEIHVFLIDTCLERVIEVTRINGNFLQKLVLQVSSAM